MPAKATSGRRNGSGAEKVRRKRRGGGLRTCLGCGGRFPPEQLIRLIAGPEGALGVDIRRRAGGRGAHCCYQSKCVEVCLRKRQLGRVLRAGVQGTLDVILSAIESQLAARVCFFLSLAQKSGRIASGAQGIGMAVRAGQVRFLVVASDASEGSLAKLTAVPRANGIAVYGVPLDREGLGRVLGKGPRAGAALRNGPLAMSLQDDLMRLQEIVGR